MPEVYFKELVENLPEMVFEIDSNGIIIYVNSACYTFLGYTHDEMIGASGFRFLSPEVLEESKNRVFSLVNSQDEELSGDLPFITKDGRTIPCHISLRAVKKDDDSPVFCGVMMDISMRKKLEEKLSRSEYRLRRLSDMTLDGVVFFSHGVIIDANKSFCETFCYEKDEIIGKTIVDFCPPDTVEFVNSVIRSGSEKTVEAKGIRKNGELFDLEFSTESFYQDSDKIHTIVIRDISQRKKMEYISIHDELTGILNYRGFVKNLKESIEFAASHLLKIVVMAIHMTRDPYSVMSNVSVDLEKILLNAIPIEISERLQELFAQEDSIARTGENEFMTLHLLPITHDQDMIVSLLQNLVSTLSEQYANGIRLEPRLGVTFYPDDADSNNPMQLINNSRYACDEAQHINREYMFYDEKSHRETRQRIEFMRDLIIAVKDERCRKFKLLYQPKVNHEGHIVGVEALIRWCNPLWQSGNSGFVSPIRFIEAAEESGLIVELGKWVVMEACRQTKDWQKRFKHFHDLEVAVNVSPQQLDEEFIHYLDYVIAEQHMSPELLELEITERETVKDKNMRVIDTIRKKNISIAIDDFGIDYSSLSKLPKLSVNTIKLDKSYIDNIAIDPDYEKLVYHTIQMVHGFKYTTVAEGVENKNQVDKLFDEMGCDKIQGHYFSKPLTVEEFERMFCDTKVIGRKCK